jgi:hypothetical protein
MLQIQNMCGIFVVHYLIHMKKIILNLAAAIVGITALKSKHVEGNEPMTTVATVANSKNICITPTDINGCDSLNRGGRGGLLAFYKAVLKKLGANETPEKIKFLEAWRRGEGGHARNNPFNTTKDVPGDADTKYNSVGVRNYPDPQTGLEATIATLTLPYYKDIVNLLRKDNVTAKEIAHCRSLKIWGTGNNVKKVLALGDIDIQALAA